MTDDKLSTEELQQLLEQDKNERLHNCRREIEVILQIYKCELIALPQINVEGRIVAELKIMIKQRAGL